ncbi:MAG TPA: DUF3108 domain-containing protein [Bryobacteraceae bacterium]|jgi:hypothetical protein|nr:DUF3108 domain-containing protein [Bryobacteraceae bacterium]
MTGLRWRAAILSTFLALSPFATGQDSPRTLLFGPGDTAPGSEVLNYQIEWRLIPAGSAKMTWTMMPRSAAAPNELRLHLESTGLVSRLYRVDDDYTSSLGQNLCAQNSFFSAHEGSRNRETRVTYDNQAHKAINIEKDLNKNSSAMHEVDIPPCVHDVLGGLLVLRTLHLEPGKTVRIPVSDGKKFVQVRIESQRREEISTGVGTRKTIRYEVFLFDNVLYKRSGHLHVWLTDDNLRLPVQLQVRLPFAIGTITLKLEKEEKL